MMPLSIVQTILNALQLVVDHFSMAVDCYKICTRTPERTHTQKFPFSKGRAIE